MNNKLDNLRKQIDIVDEKLLTLFAKRTMLVRRISKFKKSHNIPILDKDRRNEVLNTQLSKGEELGLSKDLIKKLYSLIHKYSIKIQKEGVR